MKKKKILIIDDDIIFKNIMSSVLSEEFEILLAQSGDEALKLLIKNMPDLILLDIIMPGLDGWETFHRIKGLTLLHDIPIAFITSLSKEEGLDQAKRLGAAGYFIKPIKRENLINEIKKILSGEKLI